MDLGSPAMELTLNLWFPGYSSPWGMMLSYAISAVSTQNLEQSLAGFSLICKEKKVYIVSGTFLWPGMVSPSNCNIYLHGQNTIIR